jgi:hypothetical protein
MGGTVAKIGFKETGLKRVSGQNCFGPFCFKNQQPNAWILFWNTISFFGNKKLFPKQFAKQAIDTCFQKQFSSKVTKLCGKQQKRVLILSA